MLIVAPSNQLLLIKSHKSSDRWTVPGGHIEFGERVEDAVRREAREETGLEVHPTRLLIVQDLISPNPYHEGGHFVCLYYLCQTTNPQVKLDGRELQEYHWADLDEAFEMPLTSYARILLANYVGELAGEELAKRMHLTHESANFNARSADA
jgi:nucleoside triphosphatase